MKNSNNLLLVKQNGSYVVAEAAALAQRIDVAAGACFDLIFVQFCEPIDLKINLTEKSASCQIRGIYLGAQDKHLSLTIDVSHTAPETHSTQLVRGILTDSAQQRFAGVIRMPKDSQKCSGNQNHRAVLLSDKAFAQATPELEIYADDVVCSHGSAVGPLDEGQLFYLLSRGIDEKTARQMLLMSFVCDIVPEEYQPIVQEWFNAHI